jgi:hypothetical protein
MTTSSTREHSSFLSRLIGAAALRAVTYEEVESDRRATGQAVAVVALSSLAAGIGTRGFGAGGPGDLLFFSAVALMAWVAWAFVVYAIGARILPEAQTRADVGELLRTTGFATAPGLIRILGVWPAVTTLVFTGAALWMLLAMIVAVRQALEYTTTSRAVAVCVFGWILAIAIAAVFGFFFGPSVS